jgi:hypothetical protein
VNVAEKSQVFDGGRLEKGLSHAFRFLIVNATKLPPRSLSGIVAFV